MSSNTAKSFDPIWEEKYKDGHQQKAPWDQAVSFVYRHRPRDKAEKDTKILEVGCGTASNLWFFALEGFDVTGLEGSQSAIDTAQKRFDQFSLSGRLEQGDFTQLPYDDNEFDLVIDRGALCCCDLQNQKKAIKDIHRVLAPKSKFMFTPFSNEHTSSQSGTKGEDGIVQNIGKGTLTGVGQICFLTRDDIDDVLPSEKWKMLALEHNVKTDLFDNGYGINAAWKIIAQKI